MSSLQDDIVQALQQSAERLRLPGLPYTLAEELTTLAGKVYEPCVVAVVGRVKAGKSTFINALLGTREDLATVGTSETTATINYFRYGNPADPARPVRCHWRGGGYEDVNASFLHELQGNDEDTLRRADGIAYMEYRLPLDYLRRVTLVDTPGTGAVVEEHQGRTAEYMRLYGQLRERHTQETQQIGETSDAIIYLINAVARATDRDFLEEFSQATQGKSRALNAIGVLAKIDLFPDAVARRESLATKMAAQLKDGLNTVVPVSAGLHRTLERLFDDNATGLRRLMDSLRQIPPARLAKLLENSQFYREYEFDDCPLGKGERCALLGTMDWTVFTTIGRLAADPALDLDEIVAQVQRIAGFGPLSEILESHFLKRSEFLRCHRILGDARRLIGTIRYQHLPALRQRERDDATRRARFLAFIHGSPGDRETAKELAEWVENMAAAHTTHVKEAVDAVDRELGQTFYALEAYNADFEAVQSLEKDADLFSTEELDELRGLLGLYGLVTAERLPAGHSHDIDYVEQRQMHWRNLSTMDRTPVRRIVADRAVARLGLILDELAS